MKLVPLGDRVVLKQLVAEETTKSGIVLPGQNKETPQQAEVTEKSLHHAGLRSFITNSPAPLLTVILLVSP